MKKYLNLTLFLVVTFFRSIFLGMSKIFLRASLKEDNRTLEEIAGYISLGSALSFLVGGALTYTFRKKPIIITGGIAIILCLIYGYMTDYFPLKNFAIIISTMGFFYGLWLTVKSIITTTEIMESGLSETTINALTNTSTFLGLLVGSYRGFDIYNRLQGFGVVGLILIIILATIMILFTKYDINFKKHTIYSAITKNITNIICAIKKYFIYLIPIGILWAVSTALGQKMLEIGIDVMKKETTKGISIIVFSMLGAIAGHILSTQIKIRKQQIGILLTILLAISATFFPNLLAQKDSFGFMTWYSIYLGVIFGMIVNMIEGKFYHKIGEDNRKEFGSAAYGIITSIIIFGVMIIGNTVSKHLGINASFICYGIIIFTIIPFLRRIK